MLLVASLIIVVALWKVIRYLESDGVFFPVKTITQTPAALKLEFEDVYIDTPDGKRINAWFVHGQTGGATILYAHGNGGNMSDRLMKVKFFHDLGFSVMLFDYRGYGNSTGFPSEEGIYTDGLAAYDYLVTRKVIDKNRIILYGGSLGGIVAVDTASKRPCAALIVDSSITSAKEVAKAYYPYLPAFMTRLKFDSITKIKAIKAPKLIIHSPADHTIPYAMGVKLFEAAGEPKVFIKATGDHDELQMARSEKTMAEFRLFLEKLNLL